jgi:hypothetical protein
MKADEGVRSSGAMSERQRRLALNEAVFRDVNERIRNTHERFELNPSTLDLVCECGQIDCTERLTMSLADYEGVRADARQFAIVPGHDDDAVEVILARRDTYDLVRKRPGEPAEVAEATDPRA